MERTWPCLSRAPALLLASLCCAVAVQFGRRQGSRDLLHDSAIPDGTAACRAMADLDKEFKCCELYVAHPSMRIMETWGDLSARDQALWRELDCDRFKTARACARHRDAPGARAAWATPSVVLLGPDVHGGAVTHTTAFASVLLAIYKRATPLREMAARGAATRGAGRALHVSSATRPSDAFVCASMSTLSSSDGIRKGPHSCRRQCAVRVIRPRPRHGSYGNAPRALKQPFIGRSARPPARRRVSE